MRDSRTRRRAVALLASSLLILTAAVVSSCASELPAGAIATVGDETMTKKQLQTFLTQAEAAAEQSDASDFPEPDTAAYKQYVGQVVEYLVTQRVIEQAAADMDITVTTAEVTTQVEQIEEAYGGRDQVEELLGRQAMTYADFRSYLREQLVSQAVWEEVIADTAVTNAEARGYYDDHEDEYSTDETRTTRHILVKTKSAAQEVRALLLDDSSAASWKRLAKELSTDTATKSKGGQLGAVAAGDTVAAFEKAVFSAEKGAISLPVKTRYGWHVLQVTKITPGDTVSFADAKQDIKDSLLAQEQSETWDAWLQERTEEADVRYAAAYDPTRLAKAVDDASPSPSASASP